LTVIVVINNIAIKDNDSKVVKSSDQIVDLCHTVQWYYIVQ